jgi:hypothetical protein
MWDFDACVCAYADRFDPRWIQYEFDFELPPILFFIISSLSLALLLLLLFPENNIN